MFAEANTLARAFTRPVVIVVRRLDEAVTASIAAYVVVNSDGWVVTAMHVLSQADELRAGEAGGKEYLRRREEIENSTEKMSDKERSRRLNRLKADPAWVKGWLYAWAPNNAKLVDVSALPEVDLAIGRLDPFDPNWIPRYPVFKDPSKKLEPGTSLCRLGFPFERVDATWDPAGNHVHINGHPPYFPIEGIFTRNIRVEGEHAHGYNLTFLETSSPGLRGQSGGPIFDMHGTIWGIQSQTRHYPLGFSPPVPNGKPGEKEHQFLNVGWGIHPETLMGFMDSCGVRYELSTY